MAEQILALAVLYSPNSDSDEARERALAMAEDREEVVMELEVQVAKEARVVRAEEAISTSTTIGIHPTMDAYPIRRIYSGVLKWTARVTSLTITAIIKPQEHIGCAQEMACK